MHDGAAELARIGKVVADRARRNSETILITLKSAVAATAAWTVAFPVLHLSFPAFAPFSAVLLVQVTVYRTLHQSLLYVLAVMLGVAVQSGLGFALGPHIWTFAAICLCTLVIGRWRRLENQGQQVVVAALFAYSAFVTATSGGQRLVQLGMIVALVALGATIGATVNLVFFPPMRYRGVEYSIEQLTRTLAGMLFDICEVLSEGAPESGKAQTWQQRVRDFQASVEQGRDAVAHAQESVRLNPRRLVTPHPTEFTYNLAVINTLGRAGEQLLAITQGLERVESGEELTREQRAFLHDYAALLYNAARAVDDLSAIDQVRHHGEVDQLTDHIREGKQQYERLSREAAESRLDVPGSWPVYGGLLIDAERIIEEFEWAREQLADGGPPA